MGKCMTEYYSERIRTISYRAVSGVSEFYLETKRIHNINTYPLRVQGIES